MQSQRRGFSLVEVAIAVGVFASALVVVLALLPSLGAQSARAGESFVAQRLPDALRIELQRLAAEGGFESLAAQVPPLGGPQPPDGLAFVATRGGRSLHALDYLPPTNGARMPEAEQFFLIEVWRFAVGPLAEAPAGVVLPVKVRVSWPYRGTGAGVVALRERSTLEFNLTLRR